MIITATHSIGTEIHNIAFFSVFKICYGTLPLSPYYLRIYTHAHTQ